MATVSTELTPQVLGRESGEQTLASDFSPVGAPLGSDFLVAWVRGEPDPACGNSPCTRAEVSLQVSVLPSLPTTRYFQGHEVYRLPAASGGIRNLHVASAGGVGLLAWEDETTPNNTPIRIRVLRVDASGAPIGAPVTVATGTLTLDDVASDGANFAISWSSTAGTGGNAALLSASGALSPTVPLGYGNALSHLSPTPSGWLLVAGTGGGIAKRLQPNLTPVDGIERDLSLSARKLCVVTNSQGVTMVAHLSGYYAMRAQFIAADGTVMNGSIPVDVVAFDATPLTQPLCGVDGTAFSVAWVRLTTDGEIKLARLTPSGLLSGPSTISVGRPRDVNGNNLTGGCSNGECGAVFLRDTSVSVQTFRPAALPVVVTATSMNSRLNSFEYPAGATSGGRTLVAWTDTREGRPLATWGAWVGNDGQLATTPRSLGQLETPYGGPSVACTSSRCVAGGSSLVVVDSQGQPGARFDARQADGGAVSCSAGATGSAVVLGCVGRDNAAKVYLGALPDSQFAGPLVLAEVAASRAVDKPEVHCTGTTCLVSWPTTLSDGGTAWVGKVVTPSLGEMDWVLTGGRRLVAASASNQDLLLFTSESDGGLGVGPLSGAPMAVLDASELGTVVTALHDGVRHVLVSRASDGGTALSTMNREGTGIEATLRLAGVDPLWTAVSVGDGGSLLLQSRYASATRVSWATRLFVQPVGRR